VILTHCSDLLKSTKALIAGLILQYLQSIHCHIYNSLS